MTDKQEPIGFIGGRAVQKMLRGHSRFTCIFPEPTREYVIPVYLDAPAALTAEPVAWQWFYYKQWHVTNDPERAEDVAKGGDVEVIPLYTTPAAASQPDRAKLRQLVDLVWNEATESTAVPSTKWADELIEKVLGSVTASSRVPDDELRAQGCDMFAAAQLELSHQRRAAGDKELADIYNDNSLDAQVFAKRLRAKSAAPSPTSAEGGENV